MNHTSQSLVAFMFVCGLSGVAACKGQTEPGIQPEKPAVSVVDAANVDAPTFDAANVDASKPAACPVGLSGSPMVQVSSPDGTSYCIDQREASQGDYFQFLGAFYDDPAGQIKMKPDAGQWAMPPGCDGNTMLMPSFGAEDNACTQSPQAFSQHNAFPDYPIACVDWCDAYAYCAWAGKRLCGKVGGGSWAETDAIDANKSERYNVCTQGGKTIYSYGDVFRPDLLSEADPGVDGSVPVNAVTACRGTTPPFDGVANIGCNIAEWQGTCVKISGFTGCTVYSQLVNGVPREKASRCDSYIHTGYEYPDPRLGFRCCHD